MGDSFVRRFINIKTPLVVRIDDLDFLRVPIPDKADSPLIVDANTVLAGTVSLQFFKPITRHCAQILKALRGVEHCELPKRHPLDGLKALATLPLEKRFRVRASKTLNHNDEVITFDVKRQEATDATVGASMARP